MRLINKETGETSIVSSAGAERLLARGTHELADKPATKAKATKKPAAAAKYEGGPEPLEA